jgi:hypothetical protein
LNEESYLDASSNTLIAERIDLVRQTRLKSSRETTKKLAQFPYRFGELRQAGTETVIVIPAVSSENRDYLPVDILAAGNIISNRNFGIYDASLHYFALLVSRLHWVWIDAVCGKLEMRFNYSNTIGWNNFPVPQLTAKNEADLMKCAEDILLAREVHFPATIADLYDPEKMPTNLREAHERNDETLERIYIGRRFKNDTERLAKLFDLYTQMCSKLQANNAKMDAK